MNAKKIELVQQLLAKAESTTPEEAEALTAAAEKIMLRLGIDDAMLAANARTDTSPMTSKTIWFEGVYSMGLVHGIYQALVAFNTCHALRSQRRASRTTSDYGLTIYGRQSQVERMEAILTSLAIQARVALDSWWRAEGADAYDGFSQSVKFRARRQFLMSFGVGAAERITQERKIAESESTGSALVLRSEVDRAKQYAHEQAGSIRSGRRMKGGSRAAHHSGRAAGQRANVGTTQVGGQRHQISA